MARTAWPTVLSGDSWSASQHNTYGRDNDLAYWVFTTAGDLAYATSSTTLARLALTTGGLLYGGASAPAWLSLVTGGILYGGASAPAWLEKPASMKSFLTNDSSGSLAWKSAGIFPAIGYASFAPGQSTTGTTFIDVTSATLNLTLPAGNTYTVIALAGVSAYVSNSAYSCQVCANIDGTIDPNQLSITGSTATNGISVGYRRTGIASGTRTVKLQFRVFSSGATATVDRGWLMAFAVTE